MLIAPVSLVASYLIQLQWIYESNKIPLSTRFTWIRRCFTFCVRCAAATTVRCFSMCDATTIIASPLIGRSILHATHIATSSVASHLRRAMHYHRERGAPQRTSTRLRVFVVRDYTQSYCTAPLITPSREHSSCPRPRITVRRWWRFIRRRSTIWAYYTTRIL